MSDRGTVGTDAAVPAWFAEMAERVRTLEQRPQGSPNGLILPGGVSAGTWLPIGTAAAPFVGTWLADNLGNQAPQYTIDADGFVHLRGNVRNTANWTPGAICTLPAGYASAGSEFFVCAAASNGAPGIGVAQIQQTGASVQLNSVLTAVWNAVNRVSLSGISFYAGGQ